jgi:hypothetical protein
VPSLRFAAWQLLDEAVENVRQFPLQLASCGCRPAGAGDPDVGPRADAPSPELTAQQVLTAYSPQLLLWNLREAGIPQAAPVR